MIAGLTLFVTVAGVGFSIWKHNHDKTPNVYIEEGPFSENFSNLMGEKINAQILRFVNKWTYDVQFCRMYLMPKKRNTNSKVELHVLRVNKEMKGSQSIGLITFIWPFGSEEKLREYPYWGLELTSGDLIVKKRAPREKFLEIARQRGRRSIGSMPQSSE